MESSYEVDLMTPLSAHIYLKAYYDLDDAEKLKEMAELKLLSQKFEGKNLISCTALNETWPDVKWAQNGSCEEADDVKSNLSRCSDDPTGIDRGLQKLALDAPDASKTLRDRSMETVLDNLLKQPQENEDLMAEAEILTDFVPRLRTRLYSQAADLEPSSSTLHLLHKALEFDMEVDLRPFKKFSIEYLSILFARLCNGPMRSLNLSNMPDLTESELKLIIDNDRAPSKLTATASELPAPSASTVGNLRAIILIETPNISIDFLTKNLGHCDIYHSALFLRPFKQYDYRTPPIPALNFVSPDAVSQLVWVGVSSMQSCDENFRRDDGRLDWASLRYSTEASSSYSRDTKSLKYKNFLLDVPLPTGKAIHGLHRLLRFITSPKMTWFADWSKGAAPCFATASPQNDGSEYNVGPLSRLLYQDHDREENVQSGRRQALELDRWAIVLVQEAFDAKNQAALDKRELEMVDMFGPRGTEGMKEWPAEQKEATFKPLKRLRYVLAKALPESEAAERRFLTTDITGYLKCALGKENESGSEAQGLSNWWKKETSNFGDSLGYYEDDDIHEILDKIYPIEPLVEDNEPRPRGVDPFEDIMRMITMARQT